MIIVLDRRQYAIQELLCDLELPRDIHLKNSLENSLASVRQDSKEYNIPIINEEIGKCELMGVEQERRHAKGEDRHPEVSNPRRPHRDRHVEEHDQTPHAQVDARSGKSREQDTERNTGYSETTSCGDVSSTSECQIAGDRVRRDTS